MSRKQFIESYGATCRNWTWSWSFINEAKKFIIFGAWDVNQEGPMSLIFSEKWQLSRRGLRNAAYSQSREHVRLIEEEGYRLLTFPMKYSKAKHDGGGGPAVIGGFTPTLTERSLVRIGMDWYASDNQPASYLPEEVVVSTPLVEGATRQVTVNAYERNPLARAQCLAKFGYSCCTCGFNFEHIYGELGRQYIHVHHLVPLSEIQAEYVVDPLKDLVPICPNCHAMIHRTIPARSITELRAILERSGHDGA
jgi:5-methylcytosine-specific restriction protein A